MSRAASGRFQFGHPSRRTRWAASLALAMLLAAQTGCDARSTAKSDEGSAADAAPQTGELLIASAPEGWVQVGGLNQGQVRIAEYANPENLSPDRVDSVRFESQAGDPLPDPIDFLLGMREELREQCKGIRDFPISSGYENGYPTSVRLILCREKGDPPRGEVRMIKAIRGAEQFYIVSRSRNAPPFAPEQEPMSVEDMATWSAWFAGIRVCDTRTTAHSCLPGVQTRNELPERVSRQSD